VSNVSYKDINVYLYIKVINKMFALKVTMTMIWWPRKK